MIKLIHVEVTSPNGEQKIFNIQSLNDKICYVAENGNWFEDEARYFQQWCSENDTTIMFSKTEICPASLEWSDSYYK